MAFSELGRKRHERDIAKFILASSARDLEWHGYGPAPEVRSLEAFLNVVDRDEYCCFVG